MTPDSLEDGDLVAFEDRQSLSHDWPQRPVYVLVEDENIYLCDDRGALINESDTPGGVQTLDGDDGFMAQTSGEKDTTASRRKRRAVRAVRAAVRAVRAVRAAPTAPINLGPARQTTRRTWTT